jgi:GMP synthase (glutamine-hydrolysing)
MADVLPFLLLSTRDSAAAALGEWRSTQHIAGLDDADLCQFRLDQAPLGPIDLADYSGFLVGGSDYCVSTVDKSPVQRRVEEDLARLVDQVLAEDFPFFGLCYGVGLLTAHLGGSVDQTYHEAVGAIPITLTPAGRADPLCAGLPDTFAAFVGHKEAASRLPDQATLLATGEVCPVQLFRIGANVYASQFHPELDPDTLVERMRIYQNDGYFDPADFDRIATAAYASAVDGTQHRFLRNFAERFARGC